jgi:hypothetical protein
MSLELSKPTFSSNISECGKNIILRSFTLSTQEEKQTGVRSRRMRRAGYKKCIQNFTRKNLKGI